MSAVESSSGSITLFEPDDRVMYSRELLERLGVPREDGIWEAHGTVWQVTKMNRMSQVVVVRWDGSARLYLASNRTLEHAR